MSGSIARSVREIKRDIRSIVAEPDHGAMPGGGICVPKPLTRVVGRPKEDL